MYVRACVRACVCVCVCVRERERERERLVSCGERGRVDGGGGVALRQLEREVGGRVQLKQTNTTRPTALNGD